MPGSSLSAVEVEDLAAFARRFAVIGAQIGWLFGAGTSASAGIPTAEQLIDEFKATLYASELGLDRSRVAMADPLTAERVRRYFNNAHGLTGLGDPDEYAVAFEAAYPDAAVRRQWLDRWTRQGRPSYGHRALAALMASGLAPWIATTNFDQLVERSYEQLSTYDESLKPPTVAAIDNSDRAARAFREKDWPLLIKLHGDITSERLKNTPGELQEQDGTLRSALVDACHQYGLGVIGYSGRDESVMGTLRAALDKDGAFPSGLFWLTSDAGDAMTGVHDLLSLARDRGVDARFVEAANFDEAFGVLAQHSRISSLLAGAVAESRPAPRVRLVALDKTEGGRFPALRLNALPVLDCPHEALRIHCRETVPALLRPLLRAVRMPGIGIASGREVLAFGVPDGWRRALAGFGPQDIETTSIEPRGAGADTLVLGLLNDAVAFALARDRPLRVILRRAGHRLIVMDSDGQLPPELAPLQAAYGDDLTGRFRGSGHPWSEGVRIRLEWRFGQLWLLFEPWTFVQREVGVQGSTGQKHRSPREGPDEETAWVKERWATRRNKIWATALGVWADLLAGKDDMPRVSLGLGDPNAIDARFVIGRHTAYSLPAAGATAERRQ